MSKWIDYDAIDYRNDKMHDKSSDFIDGVIYMAQRIEDAPSIDIPQWIPCSERLPKENEEVLVCDEDGTMEVCDLEMFGRGIGLKWTDKNGYECWLNVIAWMPLPKPYGEREGE